MNAHEENQRDHRGERVRFVPAAGAFTVVDATYVRPRQWSFHTHDQALISFAAFADYEETVDGTRLTLTIGNSAYLASR